LYFLIDKEEKKLPEYFEIYGFKEGEGYEIDTLETGDIVEENKGLGVERKTIADFWESIKDGRLHKQCLRMLDQFPNPYVFVTGYMRKLETFVNPNTQKNAVHPALGQIASILTRYKKLDEQGAILNQMQGWGGMTDKQMVYLTISVASKLDKKPITVPRLRVNSGGLTGLDTAPVRILMSIGMQEELARSILGQFGSIKAVAEATEKDLKGVFGIGDVKASLIFDSFRLMFNGDGDLAV